MYLISLIFNLHSACPTFFLLYAILDYLNTLKNHNILVLIDVDLKLDWCRCEMNNIRFI